MSEWTSIIDDLTDYLRWQQERGVRTEELSPEGWKALTSALAVPARAVAPAATAAPSLEAIGPAKPGGPPVPSPSALAVVQEKAAACTRCVLHEKRRQVVPGQGNPNSPDILFVGEAPGADEDAQGLAFVGAAGQLLTKMIAAMGYTRDEVFIANICKCRPPENRKPTTDEMQACLPYLRAQIAAIRPKTIVALGATAVQGLLATTQTISKMRGTWTVYAGIPLMPTFHPSYLLRLPSAKKDAWADLKKVLARLGKPVPEKKDSGR
jgi:DNA polymerase